MLKNLSVALVTASVLGTPAMAKTQSEQAAIDANPVTIAKTVLKSLELAPAKSLMAGAASENFIKVHQPGAHFVKVHFKQFNLPAGAYVEVSDLEGNETYRYDGVSHKQATFNPAAGENGINRFSAMSVFGDTAIVKLVMPQGAVWGPEHSIKIDQIKAGNDEQAIAEELQANFSTCGAMERKDVACWENSHPAQYERTRPLARLLMSGSGLCTGWRVGDDNRMFTNNHCIDNASTLQNTEVWFNYQHTTCGGSTFAGTVKVTGQNLLKTNYDLDYTLFTVNDFASVVGFGNYGLETSTPQLGQAIFIPQHGAGNPKEMAIESDQNANGLCQIDIAVVNGRATDSDTGYLCDTIGGSSGSPVLLDTAESSKVIALHHFGGCENQGVRIDKIWPQVSQYFNDEVPQGDNNSTGNRAPVAQFVSQCTGLSCTFDASDSTDADGTVDQYSWNINGTNASGKIVTHSFAANGSYNVSLTVTDNEGASASKTAQVAVSDNSTNELQSGAPVSNLAGAKDDELDYFINTTAGNQQVVVKTSGGSGDADLYVKVGSVPTKSDYDCRPYVAGNNEDCSVSVAATDTVYVKLIGYSAFSGVQLVATLGDTTDNGYPKTDLSGNKGNWDRYTYTVPAGVNSVVVSTSGGSGDADLYVQKGAAPTSTIYDCRPYKSGNNESCTVNVQTGDQVHIGIYAYSTYSGLTLDLK